MRSTWSVLAFLIMLVFVIPQNLYAAAEEDQKFEKLVDEYLAFLWRTSPLSATFNGIHDFDDQMESFLLKDVRKQFEETKKFVERFNQELDFAKLNETNQIDYDLIFRSLRQQEFSLNRARDLELDPSVYPQILAGIGFLMYSREYAPFEQRIKSLAKRMEQMPAVLEAGKKNLTNPPQLWTQIAIETTKGAISLYEDVIGSSVAQLAEENPTRNALQQANGKVLSSLRSYNDFLQKQLLPRSTGSFADGREKFVYRLKNFYLMDESPEQIKAKAEAVLKETENEMQLLAAQVDPQKKWWEILEEAKKKHWPAEEVLPQYQKTTERSRNWVIQKNLASIPEEKLDVVETPVFMRFVTPYAAYFSPAAFEKEQKGFYFVTPVDTSLSKEAQDGQLGELYVDIENTTVHEAYPGHHLQFIHQNRLSKIRRMSGSSLMSEGWGLYCERLADEYEFYSTPIDRLQAYRWLMVRAVRVIVDVGMHCQGMKFEEAVDFMLQHAKLERSAAEGEVRRYTQTPTQPLSYLMGMLMIRDLREQFKAKQGDQFKIGQFHDRVLSYGSVPLRYIRNSMMSQLSAEPAAKR